MNIKILKNSVGKSAQCRDYVQSHPDANIYHLLDWCRIINGAYRHDYYSLVAENRASEITGFIWLVHLKHFMFGNRLVSLPYFDAGGMLCGDEETGRALIRQAVKLGIETGADLMELRQDSAIPWINDDAGRLSIEAPEGKSNQSSFEAKGREIETDRARMILPLPDSAEELMKSFKAKLRSQIKRPKKDGLYAKHGREELLKDFYNVFCVNMRDLGSPVHSKRFIERVLKTFTDTSRIFVVYTDTTPVACSLVVGFKEYLCNPWASSLRAFSRSSPNMLLYWSMLEYGCNHGYQYFDFGRSTPGEGTYRFKKQWGADQKPLFWYKLGLKNEFSGSEMKTKEKYGKFIDIWRKIPLPVAKYIGPKLRRHIDL